MKEKKKTHRLIDFLFLMLPLCLIVLSCFRTGNYNLSDIENTFSIFRQFDFGLSSYIIHNCFNDSTNVLLLLIFDLSLYHLYFMIINFAIGLFGYVFEIITYPLDMLTRGMK